MLLNDHSPYLLERISKGGDKVKALKCSECVDISLVKLQALGVLSFDVLCLQHFRNAEGKMCEDSDAKVLTACKMIALLRSQNKVQHPLHLIVQLNRAESAPLLDTVCSNPGMTMEYLISDEVEAGVIVQMLDSPALKPAYKALLEAGSDLFLIPAELMLPLNQPLSFSSISEMVLNRKAVAMGIRFANGEFTLSPQKTRKFSLGAGDQIIVVADFE